MEYIKIEKEKSKDLYLKTGRSYNVCVLSEIIGSVKGRVSKVVIQSQQFTNIYKKPNLKVSGSNNDTKKIG